MKLENEFTVPAPVERAWDVLLDVERVAPCLPGAAIEGSDGSEHHGSMTIKLGPITQRYQGTVRIERADADARHAVMRASARDARGQGTAAATISTRMETVGDMTRVRVETDMQITGPAAQFGRGVMQEVSAKMMRRFAECLADEIAAEAAGADAGADGPAAPGAAPEARVATGRAGIELPRGPAAAAAEAVARARAHGGTAPARSPAAPSASDDVASPPRARVRPTEDVLDLGEVSRDAVLKRVVPAAALLAALVALLVALRARRR